MVAISICADDIRGRIREGAQQELQTYRLAGIYRETIVKFCLLSCITLAALTSKGKSI